MNFTGFSCVSGIIDRVPLKRKLTSKREGVGSSGLNNSEAAFQHSRTRHTRPQNFKCSHKYDKLNFKSS